MNGLALSDDRTLERAVFQKSDACPHIHAALDAGAGNDPIADGGVWIAKEYERVLGQNRQIHSAPLAGVLLVEIRHHKHPHKKVCSPRATSSRSCRYWG